MRSLNRLRLLVVIAALAMISATTAGVALAYSSSTVGSYTSPPNLYFHRGSTNTNGTLLSYVSIGGDRWRIAATAGSGNSGILDDCVSDYGPAPDGYYGRSDGDSLSYLNLRYKTDGSTVVRGWVWDMGSKRCDGGSTTTRWGLFIHSNGIEGTTWNGSYTTEGCVKVSQTDRGYLSTKQQLSYQSWNDRLYVLGNEQ